MYFVTVRQEGYVLFSMTPNELGAIGLAEDQQTLRLLRRDKIGDAWTKMVEWNIADLTHTDFMLSMQHREEPQTPEGLLDVLPADLRKKLGL